MSSLIFSVVLYSAFLGQSSKSSTAFQELPQDRMNDTYDVYAASLRRPIWNHPDEATTYFISNHTGQTYDLSDECLHGSEGDIVALDQAIADFRAQKGKTYRLKNRFGPNRRKLRLVQASEEDALRARLAQSPRRMPSAKNGFEEPTHLIRLSNVGFNRDRSFAILVVSDHCGTLCGGEKWHMFKRKGDQWVEQHLDGCFVISSLRPVPRR
jgi:hypothetical protein